MSDFKATPKMKSDLPCYKEGGSIQKQVKDFTKRDRKQVAEVNAPAKKVVKKAIGMHDEQQHEEKTDLTGLKKGGRAKKDCGTVRKFKVGGSVENVYGAKKASGDLDRIEKTKDIKPGKAAAPSKAAIKPAFKGSDVAKEKSKPAGEKDMIKKVKPTGDKKADAPNKAATKPSRLKDKNAIDDIGAYKKGGKIKKMANGRLAGPQTHEMALLQTLRGMDPAMMAQLLKQQQAVGGNNDLSGIANRMNPQPMPPQQAPGMGQGQMPAPRPMPPQQAPGMGQGQMPSGVNPYQD
jgi:hypothetical protein